MTPDEIRKTFIDALVSVAPDIDPGGVGDDDHIQDDLEIDSMDFLNLVSLLHKRLGVSVPEADYPQLATPARAVRYLEKALAGK